MMMLKCCSKILLGVSVLLTACVHNTRPSRQQRRCYYDSLCTIVYSTKSVETYRDADYFYWTNQDIVSNEEAMSLAKFMADSAYCVPAWDFYAIGSMFDGTDSITMLYNLLKNCALSGDFKLSVATMLPIKSTLVASLKEQPLKLLIHPDTIEAHRGMFCFKKVYGMFLKHRIDTTYYSIYR